MNDMNIDLHRMLPLEDLIDLPIMQHQGWTEARIAKQLIRTGSLEGRIDSKGEVTTSLYNIKKAVYICQIRAALELGLMEETDEEGVPVTDFDGVLFKHLVRKLFGRSSMSVAQLKSALSEL